MLAYERNPDRIYEKSFETVRGLAQLERFDPDMKAIVERVIHACGMPGIAEGIEQSTGFAGAAKTWMSEGADILCDCETVATGVIRRLLPPGSEVVVTLNEDSVKGRAQAIGNTRSAAAVELWRDQMQGSIVAIGNAPTALFHLLELLDEGWPKPAVILGFPVGFVGAAESKRELASNPRGCEFMTLGGTWGGSAMASAAVNAIALLASARFAEA